MWASGIYGQSVSATSSETIVDDVAPVVWDVQTYDKWGFYRTKFCYYLDMEVTWQATDDNFSQNPIEINMSVDPGNTMTPVTGYIQNDGSEFIDPLNIHTAFGKVWVQARDSFGNRDTSVSGNLALWPLYMYLSIQLEGSYNGSNMNTNLNNANLIPLNQPFNIPPWNYSGSESVVSIPNDDIVDWVLVEIRETDGGPSGATSNTAKDIRACFVDKSGNICSLDGSQPLIYNFGFSDSLYAVVHHINHLDIMSLGLSWWGYGACFDDCLYQYYRIYGGRNALKDLGSGYFGLCTGDCDGNDTIDQHDIDSVWVKQFGNKGYYSGDMNMDTEVLNQDKNNFWFNNRGRYSHVPD